MVCVVGREVSRVSVSCAGGKSGCFYGGDGIAEGNFNVNAAVAKLCCWVNGWMTNQTDCSDDASTYTTSVSDAALIIQQLLLLLIETNAMMNH